MRTRRLAAGMAAVFTMALAGVASGQTGAPPEQAGPATPREPPRADQPLIQRIPEPTLSVEGGFGALGFIGGTAAVGPSWNVRVTGTLSPRVAIEGNYVGAVNKRVLVDRSLVMTSVDAGVRYNLLRADQAFVQPFVVAGVGYAGWAGEGGDAFSMTLPVSAGVERLVTRNIKVGARFNVRPAFFDDLSLDGRGQAGGDSWTLIAHGGGAF